MRIYFGFVRNHRIEAKVSDRDSFRANLNYSESFRNLYPNLCESIPTKTKKFCNLVFWKSFENQYNSIRDFYPNESGFKLIETGYSIWINPFYGLKISFGIIGWIPKFLTGIISSQFELFRSILEPSIQMNPNASGLKLIKTGYSIWIEAKVSDRNSFRANLNFIPNYSGICIPANVRSNAKSFQTRFLKIVRKLIRFNPNQIFNPSDSEWIRTPIDRNRIFTLKFNFSNWNY